MNRINIRSAVYLLVAIGLALGVRGPRAAAGGPERAKPPIVIPVAGYGGGALDPDPGAQADRHLFAGIIDNTERTSASLARNCPGVGPDSTCQPYKYVNFLKNYCDTEITREAYIFATGNIETAFLHTYSGPRTRGNRLLFDAETPNGCGPDNPDAALRMNPGDRTYNAYLYRNFWTGSDYERDFPPPYGIFEDDGSLLGGIIVGGFNEVSTEYGSGVHPSGFADRVGNSPYRERIDWESALGEFANGACAAACRNMAINGVATGSGFVGPCDVISGGRCHGRYHAGMVDDQIAIDNVCAAASRGNLKYLVAEQPIYGGRFGYQFMDSQTMTVEINTIANLYKHTTGGCAQTKIVDAEPSYGAGGVGDVEGGHRVRTATLAFRWLVANPSTEVPDRVISFQYTIGRTTTEVPYFFEDTLVPYGPEHAVRRFVWNGHTETVGGGCPSAKGDRGGAIDLLVTCVGSAGVYCQQYRHLFINEADYGAVAACLNTGARPANIARSWFRGDPISSYRYALALKGGEMTSVPYRGVPGGSIPLPACTNSQFCTGSSSLSAQAEPFKPDGSETLCGPCGIVLLEKK